MNRKRHIHYLEDKSAQRTVLKFTIFRLVQKIIKKGIIKFLIKYTIYLKKIKIEM